MAIAYDNSSQKTISTGNFSFTLVVSASATCGCVFFGVASAVTVSSITWGGTSMGAAVDSNSNSGIGAMYVLVNPPTGTVTIAINFSPSNTTNGLAMALSLTGTATASPVDSHANAGTSADPGGGAVTANATTDCTVDGIFVNGSLASNLSASNGQSIKQNINDSVNGQGGAISFLTPVTNGSNTLHYTNTNANGADWVGVSIKVGGAAAAVTQDAARLFLGVGM